MQRKRYVKLLMARGYDRNEANAKAQNALRCIGDYNSAMLAEDLQSFVESDDFTRAVQAIATAISEAMVAVKHFSGAIAKVGISNNDMECALRRMNEKPTYHEKCGVLFKNNRR